MMKNTSPRKKLQCSLMGMPKTVIIFGEGKIAAAPI